MKTAGLREFAKENDLTSCRTYVFGYYKNYLIQVSEAYGAKIIRLTVNDISDEKKQTLTDSLKNKENEIGFTDSIVELNQIIVSISETFRASKKEKIQKVVDFLVEFALEKNLKTPKGCIKCKNENINTSAYNLDRAVHFYCDFCETKVKDELSEIKREYYRQEKYYAKGLLGALLYSLPVILSWVILEVYLERVASLNAMLAGFLSVKGYQKFGGVLGPYTKWILIAVNILIVFASVTASIFYLLVDSGASLAKAFDAIENNAEVISIYRQSLRLGFGMSIIVWIYLLFLYNSMIKFSKLKKVKTL
ncbi:MAG: hypothetical protein OEZ13_03150 [Spirochaetia bacterium]|nr:hypothetical protein [Spirochaetia bacterium]